jgi:hypothetical protein
VRGRLCTATRLARKCSQFDEVSATSPTLPAFGKQDHTPCMSKILSQLGSEGCWLIDQGRLRAKQVGDGISFPCTPCAPPRCRARSIPSTGPPYERLLGCSWGLGTQVQLQQCRLQARSVGGAAARPRKGIVQRGAQRMRAPGRGGRPRA